MMHDHHESDPETPPPAPPVTDGRQTRTADGQSGELVPEPEASASATIQSKTPLPNEIRGMADDARLATQRRDWFEAWRRWEAVLTRYPQHAPAFVASAHALRNLGRYDEAEVTLGEGVERFPDDEQIAMARGWLANARHDWPAALSRWEAVRRRFPDNPWCYLGNINALRGAGCVDQVGSLLDAADSALIAAKQRGLDAAAASVLELEIAKARLDWPAMQRSAKKIIACEAMPSAQVFLALAQACWHLGDPDEADRAASRASSADPTLVEAVVIRAWAATERGDGEAALSCYRTLAELNPGAARWPLKVVQLLNWLGRVKEAVSELENVRKRWPIDPMVRMFARNYGPAGVMDLSSANAATFPAEGDPDRAEQEEFQTLADKAPSPAEQVRPLIVADPECDVLMAKVNEAETAVLVFTGSNDAVSMPLPIFDHYLATLNITVVYLKDFNRLRFLRGIQSLSENYQGTLAALRDMLRRLGVKRLCTIGNCDGGFAAIRYGVELRAERILTFGASTYIPQNSFMKIEQARNFMRNRLAAKVPGDMVDLKPFLQAAPPGAQIELFYEEEDPRDRVQALHLEGLPGVRLHPKPGLSNHHLLRRLALSHENFRGMLGELLGVGPSAMG